MIQKKSDQFKYLYLINGGSNLEGKLYLLEKMLDEADELLKGRRDGIVIRKLHYLQLDIIAKLCSVVEDFLYFHKALREKFKHIHREILDNKTYWATNEAEYFRKNLNYREVKKNMRIPDISKLGLDSDDQKVLRYALEKNIRFHQTNLNAIGHFWKEHREIYNIYKHGCSIITGMYNQNEPNKPSHFYARMFEGARKKGRKKNRVKTYMIACEDKIFSAYDSMRMQVQAEFSSLLKHHQMMIVNPTESFVPELYGIDDIDEQKKINRILTSIQGDLLQPSTLQRNIEIKDIALQKIRRKSGFYITRIRRDLMFSSKAEVKTEIIKKM